MVFTEICPHKIWKGRQNLTGQKSGFLVFYTELSSDEKKGQHEEKESTDYFYDY